MGKQEKFLEGIKFPCFIESAKFYMDKNRERKVRVDVCLDLHDDVRKHVPGHVLAAANSMPPNKVEKLIFSEVFDERFVEIFSADEDATSARLAVTAEKVTIKKVRLECDVHAGLVTLHFSFVGADDEIGSWIHENYGRPALINVLAMQGELAGL